MLNAPTQATDSEKELREVRLAHSYIAMGGATGLKGMSTDLTGTAKQRSPTVMYWAHAHPSRIEVCPHNSKAEKLFSLCIPGHKNALN